MSAPSLSLVLLRVSEACDISVGVMRVSMSPPAIEARAIYCWLAAGLCVNTSEFSIGLMIGRTARDVERSLDVFARQMQVDNKLASRVRALQIEIHAEAMALAKISLRVTPEPGDPRLIAERAAAGARMGTAVSANDAALLGAAYLAINARVAELEAELLHKAPDYSSTLQRACRSLISANATLEKALYTPGEKGARRDFKTALKTLENTLATNAPKQEKAHV